MVTAQEIESLMDFVISEMMTQSKRAFEMAHVEYETQGRGALVVLLTKSHFDGTHGFASIYENEQKLKELSLAATTLDLAAKYDPTTSFALCVVFSDGDTSRWKSACIHKDAHKHAGKSNTEPYVTINNERCNFCTAYTKLAKCGRCKCTSYCSKTCQQRDWGDHKAICNTLQSWKV